MRVDCICLTSALYVLVVILGMSGPISECTVYVCWSLYHHSYHALGIENPSLSGLCLPCVLLYLVLFISYLWSNG